MSGRVESQDQLTRRYGGVLFNLVRENKDRNRVLQEINQIYKYIQEEKTFWAQVVSPTIRLQTQRHLIEELISVLKLDKLIAHFLEVLCQNRRLSNLGPILEEFFSLAQASEGIIQGVLETPIKLPKEEMDSLQKSLKKSLGKTIFLQQKIKKNLRAGTVLRIGSIMIDTSLETQLNKLRNVMKG